MRHACLALGVWALAGASRAEAPPREMAFAIAAQPLDQALAQYSLDSGLTHLSAGLGRPTIGIYKASTPVRTPLQGPAYTASLGERGQAPDAGRVQAAIAEALDEARADPPRADAPVLVGGA